MHNIIRTNNPNDFLATQWVLSLALPYYCTRQLFDNYHGTRHETNFECLKRYYISTGVSQKGDIGTWK